MRKKIFLPLAVIFGLVGAGNVAGMNSQPPAIPTPQANNDAQNYRYGKFQSPKEREFVDNILAWRDMCHNLDAKAAASTLNQTFNLMYDYLTDPRNAELTCGPISEHLVDIRIKCDGVCFRSAKDFIEYSGACKINLKDIELQERVIQRVQKNVQVHRGQRYQEEEPVVEQFENIQKTIFYQGKAALTRFLRLISGEYAIQAGRRDIPRIDAVSRLCADGPDDLFWIKFLWGMGCY